MSDSGSSSGSSRSSLSRSSPGGTGSKKKRGAAEISGGGAVEVAVQFQTALSQIREARDALLSGREIPEQIKAAQERAAVSVHKNAEERNAAHSSKAEENTKIRGERSAKEEGGKAQVHVELTPQPNPIELELRREAMSARETAEKTAGDLKDLKEHMQRFEEKLERVLKESISASMRQNQNIPYAQQAPSLPQIPRTSPVYQKSAQEIEKELEERINKKFEFESKQLEEKAQKQSETINILSNKLQALEEENAQLLKEKKLHDEMQMMLSDDSESDIVTKRVTTSFLGKAGKLSSTAPAPLSSLNNESSISLEDSIS